MKEKPKTTQQLDEEIQEVKAEIRCLKKNHVEQFNESWLDGQEVAHALHISLRTLQTMRFSGKLPFSHLCNKFYYKVSDVKELLESNYSNADQIQGHD